MASPPAPELNADQPIFRAVFGSDWDKLPPVMKQHYAVRPFGEDVVRLEGRLDVFVSPFVAVLARITGILPAHAGKAVPVAVVFRSDAAGNFHFARSFDYPAKGPGKGPGKGRVRFDSYMQWTQGNELVEVMRYGVGWRVAFAWDGGEVVLRHRGYVWRVFGKLIPIPLGWLLGEGSAEETPISADRFRMATRVRHPWFGETFGYAGEFRVTEVSCGPS